MEQIQQHDWVADPKNNILKSEWKCKHCHIVKVGHIPLGMVWHTDNGYVYKEPECITRNLEHETDNKA